MTGQGMTGWIRVGICVLAGSLSAAHAQLTVAANAGRSAEPAASIPRSANPAAAPVLPPTSPYVVGIGDLLNVSVWKEKDLSQTVVVRPDGKISIPLVGEVYIAGQTPIEAEAQLRDRLKSIVIEPKVTVTVTEIRSRMVYITGEVGRPGAYPLNGPLNVLQLIAQAGGLTQFAERKKIRILKANGNDKGAPFNYNSVVHGRDARHNLLLTPGDTVVVP